MSFATLLIATPIFGFSLTLDPSVLAVPTVATGLAPLVAAPEGDGSSSDAPSPDDASIDPAAAAETTRDDDVARAMERRARIGRVHRALGISTWASMTLTVVLGTIQYRNLYGFFASQGGTPCVRGNATFGQDACLGTPVPHLITAAATSALYYTTFALSFAMPDPMHLDEGSSESARRLRRHKRLRWIHFSGMALQAVLGTIIANDTAFGLDRANHYRALQSLATVHLLTGFATYGTLTYAGALMIRH